MSEDILKG